LESWLAVGRKETEAPEVFELPRRRGIAAEWMRRPGWIWRRLRGRDDFDFPGTYALLDLPPKRPNIVHCHNLHGRYFDLRALPWLCRQVPLVVTLHDMWLLTGRCAHALDCGEWLAGCETCERRRFKMLPFLQRDAAALNLRRKRAILSECRLAVATPSRWLMRQAERSLPAQTLSGARVIPNGIDGKVFRPGGKAEARKRLGLPAGSVLLLCSAWEIRRNFCKDYETVRRASERIAARLPERRVKLIVLGEKGRPERAGELEIRCIPFQTDPNIVATYYQAADVFLHAVRAEVLGMVLLEAMACGLPTVATAVGGIPEQILDGKTGFLVGRGDAEAMAERALRLLQDTSLAGWIGGRATEHSLRRFSLSGQADAYLSWYEELLAEWTPSPP
jgi:glycosyltransferase involved in cell wall biosynthesis